MEETGKPIAQVARDLGVNEGTLGNWVNQARAARDGHGDLSKDDLEELRRLRAEVAELRMERDVLSDPWSPDHSPTLEEGVSFRPGRHGISIQAASTVAPSTG